ncbi:hypothetical protein MMC18_000095 [Xylographa bjoerkii]|nr:hypothetical protein [Xylographa bjoerkii]
MADFSGPEQKHPNLNLSPEERRLFGQVFSAADSDNLGVVTGDVALRFFPEKTKLPSEILGEIWQIADTEDKGFLTPAGFGIILRLIGYAQAGRPVSAELALKPGGPLPKFEGINGAPSPATATTPGPLQPQSSGGPIRVPPLAPDKANQYAGLFEESGAQNGLLFGGTAKQIFDRAGLPNDVLVRIWNLADTEQRGMLNVTEFIIAMHLLASYKIGALRALPQTLPSGLYEAAARRGAPPRPVSGSRPSADVSPLSAVPRQFSGVVPPRTSSPLARPPQSSPALSTQPVGAQSAPGAVWTITPPEKARFDGIFSKVDTENRGYVTGEQAVGFFSNSRLPEEDLAQIWDLADINSEGQLNRDEFAVAMHLIQQQLAKKGPLPQSLPPNLVPPTMRRQPIAPAQSTTPAFDNAANITKPKSAIDDLFGLDDMTTPAPQVPQSTGGSTTFTPASSQAPTSPLQPQHTQQSTSFKPFVPSSSFGQTMMTPQATGTSGITAPSEQGRGLQQQPRRQASNMDDLLGDNDPEISKRLTQETTELANLSNQVGTLTNQMQQVKSKRASTEQDLSQVNTQKRDFEARLSQLRSAYEQEVRDVKSLEERLSASRNDTKKVQQDLAMVQHTQQNLQTEHQQIVLALEADQKENASLKERMRQVNEEINQLKPQLEKMRSDARQQKGLVAINKKQLSTIEAERERAKGDLDEATKELAESTKDLEESKQSLEAASKDLEESKQSLQATSQMQPPTAAAATSSTPSTQRMNPFFRRTTTPSTERAISPSPFTPQAVASPNHNAFDSFFGPSFAASTPIETNSQPTVPPPTSFGAESPGGSRDESTSIGLDAAKRGPSPAKASEELLSGSPQQTRDELPSANELPPPPPQSRQITSSYLPFRDNRERSGSPSSSVGVAAPASRFGDLSGFATPTNDRQASGPLSQLAGPTSKKGSDAERTEGNSSSPFPERKSSLTPSSDSRRPSAIGTTEANNGFRGMEQTSTSPDVPGSFPGDSTPFHTPLNSSAHSEESPRQGNAPSSNTAGQGSSLKDEITQPGKPSSTNEDFDSAFAGFENHNKLPDETDRGFPSNGFAPVAQPTTHNEFPPIQEFGADDDSESDYSDHGFKDSFSPTTPQRQQADISRAENSVTEAAQRSGGDGPASAPTDSPDGRPPSENAQQSPPTYDQTVSPKSQAGGHRDSNQFPAEYGGLLPSREDPTSSSPPVQSPEEAVQSPTNGDAGSSMFGGVSSFFGGTPLSNSNTGIMGGVTSLFGRSSSSNNDAAVQDSKERAFSGTSLTPSQMPMAPGSTAAPYAYDNAQAAQSQAQYAQDKPPIPPKNAFDDFDNEFGDLSEAQTADERGEDELNASTGDAFDEFNPTFDSPAPSKGTNSSIIHGSNAFTDFDSSISGSGMASSSRQAPSTSTNHDWDAIFAGLDGNSSQANGSNHAQPTIPPKENFPIEEPTPVQYAPPPGPPPASKPQLARALTTGTEHDDPILKRLTGMGYPREESLQALEKFDYNLDKAADYLTSRA